MGRIKTIYFDSEKFILTEHNKETLDTFRQDGYKFRVSQVGGIYGAKGKELRLLDQVQGIKPEYSDWFYSQF